MGIIPLYADIIPNAFTIVKILIYWAKFFSLSSEFIGGMATPLQAFFDMQPTVMTDFCSVGANDPT